MATLAHHRTDGFGSRDRARAAAVLDRAIAAAPSYLPARRGMMRRLLGPRASAAALVRRYRLRPAMDAAYERIVRELGAVRVEISAEAGAGEPYVAMDCATASGDVDRMIEIERSVQSRVHAELGDRRWLRLLVSINPAGADAR